MDPCNRPGDVFLSGNCLFDILPKGHGSAMVGLLHSRLQIMEEDGAFRSDCSTRQREGTQLRWTARL